MKKRHICFLSLALWVGLVSCERVKDKEAVAELPKTSVEDTLVLQPDTLEIDTVLSETPTGEGYEEPVYTGSESSQATEGSTGQPAVHSKEGSRPATASKTTSAVRKTSYTRPTKLQLQQALGRDARLSSGMSLAQLKSYWLKRQHYYRRATKEVKFVSGETKIKISTEETKIETPNGKIKIEGDDLKVKPD